MPFPSPHYPGVNPTALTAILTRMFYRRRSFKETSKWLCDNLDPAIVYTGLENLPVARPLLITANHYHRPGFNTAWIALSISAAFEHEVTWILSNEWLFEGNPFAFGLRPAMRFVLKSITLTYGFLSMPTMIPGFSTPQGRTAGVRAVIEYLRQHPDAILGLTPEGMDSPDSSLRLPPQGAGRFILHLQQMGALILPTAVYERGGALNVRFGVPYRMAPPSDLSPSELDLWVRRTVMQPIDDLLKN